MILEEDSLLHFNYETTTHILSVTWPDLSTAPLPEIDNSLQKLARNIKNFDVKRMLADLRVGFRGIDEVAYKKVIEGYHHSPYRLPSGKSGTLNTGKTGLGVFRETIFPGTGKEIQFTF